MENSGHRVSEKWTMVVEICGDGGRRDNYGNEKRSERNSEHSELVFSTFLCCMESILFN